MASLDELIHVSDQEKLHAQGRQKPQPATCKNQLKGQVLPSRGALRSPSGQLKRSGGHELEGAQNDDEAGIMDGLNKYSFDQQPGVVSNAAAQDLMKNRKFTTDINDLDVRELNELDLHGRDCRDMPVHNGAEEAPSAS